LDTRKLYWWAVTRLRPRRQQPRTWVLWPAWALLNAAIILGVVLLRGGQRFPEPRRDSWTHKWRWRFEYLFQLTEYQTVDHCRQLITPGMRVLDLGAHIGYFTRLFAGLVGDNGVVYALEPHPDNHRLLLHNLKSDGLDRVIVEQSLVGAADGTAQLFIGSGHSNHTMHAAYAGAGGVIELPAARLDSLLARRNLGRFDFLKIDCEGAEPQILDGARETLRSVSTILIEVNPRALAAGGSSAARLLDQLRSLGFTPRVIEDDGSLADPVPSRPDTFNVLAQRTS
jgi:FkbM family methyltransferase